MRWRESACGRSAGLRLAVLRHLSHGGPSGHRDPKVNAILQAAADSGAECIVTRVPCAT